MKKFTFATAFWSLQITWIFILYTACDAFVSWPPTPSSTTDCSRITLAAKKKSNKNAKRTASSNRGFGVAPPTFEQTLASFKTRLPESAEDQPCPCGSGKVYSNCCAPYHKGKILPPTPLELLRSRYTAFCYRNIGYVIESTHPTCRDYQEDRIAWAKSLNKNGMFDSYEFVNLNVIDQEESGEEEAFVNFQVILRSNESGEETTVAEKSRFIKQGGKWTYASGDVRSTVQGLDDIILNQ